MFTVLIVEDDLEFCDEISDYLERYKVSVTSMCTIEGLHERLKVLKPDILILDQFVIDDDTLRSLPDIRAIYSGGIVIFTGNSDAADRILALECGADDFISKQSDPRELIARLRSIRRRVNATSPRASNIAISHTPISAISHSILDSTCLAFGQWLFDTTRGTVTAPDGVMLPLTSTEFEYLLYAERHAGELITREQISLDIFHRIYNPADRAIDNTLSRVRKVIEQYLGGDIAFRSIRGRGYIFVGLGNIAFKELDVS